MLPDTQDAVLTPYCPARNVTKDYPPTILIHGTADDNVYFRHTLKLADALFRAGREFALLPLPGLTHMVPEPIVMERLYQRISGQFQAHLGKPK